MTAKKQVKPRRRVFKIRCFLRDYYSEGSRGLTLDHEFYVVTVRGKVVSVRDARWSSGERKYGVVEIEQ